MANTIRNIYDYQFTIEKETTWGTAVDTTPSLLPTENMEFDYTPDSHDVMRARGKRGMAESDHWQNTQRMLPTAKFGFPATPLMLVNYLPALLQNSTAWTAATSVYDMYTVDYANLPAPKTNSTGATAGYFYTLTRRAPDANFSSKIASCIMRSAKFSIHPTDNNGCMYIDTEWIGKTFSRAQNPSGTVSMTNGALSTVYSWNGIGAVTYDATDLLASFHSCELNVTSGAKFIFDNTASEVIFPMWEVTGTLKLAYGAVSETLRALTLSSAIDTSGLLKIDFGNATGPDPNAAGELLMMSQCYLLNAKPDSSDAEIWTFDIKGCFGGATEYPFEMKFYQS